MRFPNQLLVRSGLCFLLTGCPDPESMAPDSPRDLSTVDLSCVQNPRTHVELLNACTSAQSVDKRPALPLLRSDGTLPSLP
jgi:hypothetical protein